MNVFIESNFNWKPMLFTANISDICPFCKSMTSNPSPCLPNITFVCLPANLEWLLQEMEKLLTMVWEEVGECIIVEVFEHFGPKFCSLGFRLVAPLKPPGAASPNPREQHFGPNFVRLGGF